MSIDTVLQADVFRPLVVFAVVATLLFLVVFTILTKRKAWKDPIGRSLMLAVLFVLGQTTPLFIASFWTFHGTVNTVAGWTWIAFEGLIGLSMAWLVVVFIRENYARGNNE